MAAFLEDGRKRNGLCMAEGTKQKLNVAELTFLKIRVNMLYHRYTGNKRLQGEGIDISEENPPCNTITP